MILRDPVKLPNSSASYYMALLTWVYSTDYASRRVLTYWLWRYPRKDLSKLLDKAFNRGTLTSAHILICCSSLLRAVETLDGHLQMLLEILTCFLHHPQIKIIATDIGDTLFFGLTIAAQRQVCTGKIEQEWPTVRKTFTVIA